MQTRERQLIAAAHRGAATDVERLLQQGIALDVRDADGRTALHHAVDAGAAQTAACLLTYGARPASRDDAGRPALDPTAVDLHLLHAIRQHYHRFHRSDDNYRSDSPHPEKWAAELADRGIVRIEGLVSPDALRLLRSEFASFVRSLGSDVVRGAATKQDYFEEEHWWPLDRAFVSNNAFKYSAQLARLSLQPELLDTARLYLGRPPVLERALAMRYLPCATADGNMFVWHHDREDQRFKVMILLTDVGPDDQHMSYVCRSHTLFHPHAMFFDNACPLDYCERHLGRLELYDAVGHAGDVFLFDTNGAHRGIRRASGRVRDVFLLELSGRGTKIWGGDVDRRAIAERPPAHDPFARFLAAEKLWDLPAERRPQSWVESLRNLSEWLGQG